VPVYLQAYLLFFLKERKIKQTYNAVGSRTKEIIFSVLGNTSYSFDRCVPIVQMHALGYRPCIYSLGYIHPI